MNVWVLLAIPTALLHAHNLRSRPSRACKGKVTSFLRRFMLPRFAWRSPNVAWFSRIVLVAMFCAPLPTDGSLDWIYWCAVLLLEIDDYVFGGDDDRWRRFWEGVRNKVRWKMQLPVPSYAPGTA